MLVIVNNDAWLKWHTIGMKYNNNQRGGTMELETVIFEVGNGVAKVVLNRPDMLNSLNE